MNSARYRHWWWRGRRAAHLVQHRSGTRRDAPGTGADAAEQLVRDHARLPHQVQAWQLDAGAQRRAHPPGTRCAGSQLDKGSMHPVSSHLKDSNSICSNLCNFILESYSLIPELQNTSFWRSWQKNIEPKFWFQENVRLFLKNMMNCKKVDIWNFKSAQ